MLTPFDHKNTDLYKYSLLLTQNLISLLEAKNNNVKTSLDERSIYYDIILSRKEWSQIQDQINGKESKSKQYLLDTALTKDFWFSKDNLDISTVANITAYAIQVTTYYHISHT